MTVCLVVPYQNTGVLLYPIDFTLEIGEIPQVLAAMHGVGNPVLDFVNDVCHVLSLNVDIESEVSTLKRVCSFRWYFAGSHCSKFS